MNILNKISIRNLKLNKKRIYIKFVLRLPFLRVTNAIRQIVWI